MEEESDKRAGGRQARQRACIDRPGDQREKPEKKGAVYGEILFIRSFAMAIKVFCRKLLI